jgi:acyl-CoA reductase-like NAD-dependent aldehyde dehydrogenase
MGVIAAIAPEVPSLLGLIDVIAPIIVGGNTVVVLASTKAPLSAMSFAEVIATSDVPAGVINILTGKKDEIAPWMASHMDIDGFDISGLAAKSHGAIRIAGAENLKRIYSFKSADPGRILAFLENKTVWHPIGL